MDLPPKLLSEISGMAIQAIQEFCDSVTIGSADEDGEINETIMPQLIIMCVEAFSLMSVYMRLEYPDMSDVEVMEKAKQVITDVAVKKALVGFIQLKDMPDTVDPVDIVQNAIKEAQKHAGN